MLPGSLPPPPPPNVRFLMKHLGRQTPEAEGPETPHTPLHGGCCHPWRSLWSYTQCTTDLVSTVALAVPKEAISLVLSVLLQSLEYQAQKALFFLSRSQVQEP